MSPSKPAGTPESSQITRLLNGSSNNPDSAELAYKALREQLKAMSERQMTSADDLSIEASHVVNHVFVKLTGNPENSWQDRSQFLAYACREIRSFLVDRARARKAAKRKGGQPTAGIEQAEDLSASTLSPEERAELSDELLKLDRALPLLEQSHPELYSVVNLRFFGDLNFEQIGAMLEIDPGTALKRWKKAQLILQREMLRTPDDAQGN